jgi:hypothetical protein
VWGTFDVESFGDALAVRIARRQLSQRLPGAEILAFAPYGEAHPTRVAGGAPVEALGPWTAARMAELADRLDCVVVTGDSLLGRSDAELAACYGVTEDEITARAPSRFFVGGLGRWEDSCPVLWHGVGGAGAAEGAGGDELRQALAGRAYVAVCDVASGRWLEAAGVEREVVVVPHPGMLASRLYTAALVDQRLEYLRVMGWYPRRERALVVQGHRGLGDRVDEIAPALERLALVLGGAVIVLVEADPCRGDGDFADALAGALAQTPFRIPVAGIEDLVASVAASAAIVTSSAALAATAASFGRPHAPADDPDALQESAPPDRILALQGELDASFDRVATIAEQAAAARDPQGDRSPGLDELLATLYALRRAHEAQGRRSAHERVVLADRVSDLAAALAAREAEVKAQQSAVVEHRRVIEAQATELAEARAALERLTAHTADLEARAAAADAEMAALRATRTFRWSAPARSVVARARRPDPPPADPTQDPSPDDPSPGDPAAG